MQVTKVDMELRARQMEEDRGCGSPLCNIERHLNPVWKMRESPGCLLPESLIRVPRNPMDLTLKLGKGEEA